MICMCGQPMRMTVLSAALLALGACGCGPEDAETTERDRALTVWSVVLAPESGELWSVTEPRIFHVQQHGVVVLEGSTENAGPGAIVHASGGASWTKTGEVGATPHSVEMLDDRFFAVLDREEHSSGFSGYVMGFPASPFLAATKVDRETGEAAGTVPFDPPAEFATPIANGRFIVAGTAPGISDWERAITLRAYELDTGDSTELVSESGLHEALCKRDSGLVLAYGVTGAPPSIALVSATFDEADSTWRTTEVALAGKRLDPDEMGCATQGSAVAIAGWDADVRRHVWLIDSAAGTVLADVPDADPPIAVRSDGNAFLVSDETGLTWASSTGETEHIDWARGVWSAPGNGGWKTPVGSGERMARLQDDIFLPGADASQTIVVSLADGSHRVLETGCNYARSAEDGSYVACARGDSETGLAHISRLETTEARELLSFAAGQSDHSTDGYTRVQVRAATTRDILLFDWYAERFYRVDATSGSVGSTADVPACDEERTLAHEGCLP